MRIAKPGTALAAIPGAPNPPARKSTLYTKTPPMADELPPCTLGFLFNDRHGYRCSAERRERCYGVAMGYV